MEKLWQMSGISATWKAVVGGALEPRAVRAACAACVDPSHKQMSD